MKRTLLLLLAQLCLLSGINVLADVVTMNDGRKISGLVISGTSREIQIKVDGASQTLRVDQIQSIEFGALSPVPAQPQPAAAQPQPVAGAPAQPVAAKPSPAPAQALPLAPQPPPAATQSSPESSRTVITLPVGTEIAIRTIDLIDSKKADSYREYAASLDDPVVVNGVTVIPVNADAILRVTNIRNSHLRRASLSTDLIAVKINGHRIDVKTGDVDSQTGSRAKRGTVGAAAGAGTGAAIGAMAGGAAGAGIGAAAGAAAGTVAGVMTAKGVTIQRETRFTYKLTEPVDINNPEAP